MVAEQLPDDIREFTDYLRGLLARLDPRGGWCAVFWQRDADGMRACLDGREPPPWDVLEALLQDLAALYGAGAAGAEAAHARSLHTAALAAHDARPGARETLTGRLGVMLREQEYAADRRARLSRRLASAATREQADALRLDLARVHDDHRRATARCAEITARVEALDRAPRRHGGPSPAYDWGGAEPVSPGEAPAPTAPVPEQRRRRRGGARFAGAADEGTGPVAVPPAAVPGPPAPGTGTSPRRTPRGARFAGAAEQEAPAPGPEPSADAVDRREAGRLVAALARLRREGRGGEAHALLIETAYGPAARFPLLADEMRRAGLDADWATLLWEAAGSLPAERLAATAEALTEAGRGEDGQRFLRQGVVRPAEEIGRAVLALDARARHRELRALLDACVRMRTPEQAARTAAPDPRRLVPLLLAAARDVSDERHWDLLHALRVAGFAA